MKPDFKKFHPQQVAKDTERAMMGRPQLHGAAEPDDEPSAVPPADPVKPAPVVDAPANPEGDAQGGQVAALKAQLDECHQRIEALEQKVGMDKPAAGADSTKPPMGPKMAADYDEDYE